MVISVIVVATGAVAVISKTATLNCHCH